jgi:hypothetical protein
VEAQSQILQGWLEVEVDVYNIYFGHNEDILKRSKTIFGYSMFIDLVRAAMKTAKI